MEPDEENALNSESEDEDYIPGAQPSEGNGCYLMHLYLILIYRILILPYVQLIYLFNYHCIVVSEEEEDGDPEAKSDESRKRKKKSAGGKQRTKRQRRRKGEDDDETEDDSDDQDFIVSEKDLEENPEEIETEDPETKARRELMEKERTDRLWEGIKIDETQKR